MYAYEDTNTTHTHTYRHSDYSRKHHISTLSQISRKFCVVYRVSSRGVFILWPTKQKRKTSFTFETILSREPEMDLVGIGQPIADACSICSARRWNGNYVSLSLTNAGSRSSSACSAAVAPPGEMTCLRYVISSRMYFTEVLLSCGLFVSSLRSIVRWYSCWTAGASPVSCGVEEEETGLPSPFGTTTFGSTATGRGAIAVPVAGAGAGGVSFRFRDVGTTSLVRSHLSLHESDRRKCRRVTALTNEPRSAGPVQSSRSLKITFVTLGSGSWMGKLTRYVTPRPLPNCCKICALSSIASIEPTYFCKLQAVEGRKRCYCNREHRAGRIYRQLRVARVHLPSEVRPQWKDAVPTYPPYPPVAHACLRYRKSAA